MSEKLPKNSSASEAPISNEEEILTNEQYQTRGALEMVLDAHAYQDEDEPEAMWESFLSELEAAKEMANQLPAWAVNNVVYEEVNKYFDDRPFDFSKKTAEEMSLPKEKLEEIVSDSLKRRIRAGNTGGVQELAKNFGISEETIRETAERELVGLLSYPDLWQTQTIAKKFKIPIEYFRSHEMMEAAKEGERELRQNGQGKEADQFMKEYDDFMASL